MNNYTKSSVKLLPVIENTNNRVTFYTEFDGEFEEGDKLYIAVNNTGITEYTLLDSMANTGTTNSSIGYELIEKEGNRIVLDIEFDTFPLNNSSLTPESCYIGRVYIRNSVINRGIINGCLIKDTSTQPLSKANIQWRQGILFDTLGTISNIDFNSKSSNDKLLLKTEINSNGKVESFYTYNNYGLGLTIINLSDNVFKLENCDITAGVFNNCELTGINNEIGGGEFYDCLIGDSYIINGGRFVECEFESSSAEWNYGHWYNSYTGDTANNPFKLFTWTDGVWEFGVVPNTCNWLNGRFIDGTFEGFQWLNGEFNSGFFSGSTWWNGIFNNGEINNSAWMNGVFNGGIIYDTTWWDGIFNNGTLYSTDTVYPYSYEWKDGTFNGGTITNITWKNGVFNNGVMSGCTWEDGEFYNGKIIGDTEWQTGTFYNGEFEDSKWLNGIFHNGIMKNSKWDEGSVYYGVFIDMNNYPYKYWNNGIWYNGTMNNVLVNRIEWYDGIANDSIFGRNTPFSIINWYDGSFNSGNFGITGSTGTYTWHNGRFYYGTFMGDDWINGTFYTGEIKTYINPKFKVNKPFKPYNDFGIFKRNNKRKRFPAKRRY